MLPILIDMDGILVNTLPEWLRRYNERTGEEVKPSDVVEYDVSKFVEDPKVLTDILNEPGFFRDLEPMPGAIVGMEAIRQERKDLVIVSTLPKKTGTAAQEKLAWVEEHLPWLGTKNVLFTARKDLISGSILFDDCVEHLHAWQKTNPDGEAISIKHPYTPKKGVHSVSGWGIFTNWAKM